jgi:hypothetical protein
MRAAGRGLIVFDYGITIEPEELTEPFLLTVATSSLLDLFEAIGLGAVTIETAELITTTAHTRDPDHQDRTIEVRAIETLVQAARSFDPSRF